MSGPSLETRIAQAAARRAPLREGADTTALRLVNSDGDALPGWTLDAFGDVLSLSLYEDLPPEREQALFDAVMAALSPRALYVKRRPREARVLANTRREQVAPSGAERGEDVESVVALENGLRFLIRPGAGLAVGLYLDMRDVRRWVRERARGLRVLNTFAYTCGFGVACAAGGAARVVNLDLSRRVLDWGAQNASLNGQRVDPRDYVAGDVFEWLRRWQKKGETFDVVILDPPSFSTAKGKAFSVARDYASLVRAAAAVVAPGGLLLACSNLSPLTPDALLGQIEKGVSQAARAVRSVTPLGASSVDFPSPKGKAPALKVFAVDL